MPHVKLQKHSAQTQTAQTQTQNTCPSAKYSGKADFDAVEFFAGKGAVSAGFQARGLRCWPFDIIDGHFMDLTKPSGFACET